MKENTTEGYAKNYLHTPVNYIAMENEPVEDVFPIENGDVPLP